MFKLKVAGGFDKPEVFGVGAFVFGAYGKDMTVIHEKTGQEPQHPGPVLRLIPADEWSAYAVRADSM